LILKPEYEIENVTAGEIVNDIVSGVALVQ
jgi:hypothetical protein